MEAGSLAIITGAPGAGKSATVAALLQRERAYLVFDTDWLLPDLGVLVGRDIATDAAIWPQYRRLWLTIAGMCECNGHGVALFIPLEPAELNAVLTPEQRAGVRWCLLDCDDTVRQSRLLARGWSRPAIAEALADAAVLREQVAQVIDTGRCAVTAVATTIDRWMAQNGGASGLRAPRMGARADVL
jgi:hypothetical protein